MTREEQPDLFGGNSRSASSERSWPLREKLKEDLAVLTKRGVFLGTSSWKYEGWLGQLYTSAR
jgi:hypothetical protein